MARIVIDPITRIGGQLRIEAEISGGRVREAWSSATMFRGIETVLKGRDPRDAWLLAQRICGTCAGVHAQASVRAVEQALGIEIPTNARLIRNIITGSVLVRDHVMTLYTASLPDWVDAGVAVTADPVETSRIARAQGPWSKSGSEHFKGVRDRLAAVVDSDQPGPFRPAWSGHPSFRLSPEQSLLLMAHSLEALEWQRDFARLLTLLSGKDTHPQTYLVGGMALVPRWGGPAASQTRQHPQVPDHNAPVALSDEGITLMRGLVTDARTFIDQVLVPDTQLLIAAYPEWVAIGAGPGNYLSNGEFPLDAGKKATYLFPGGALMDGNLERSQPVSESSVGESVAHAWYTYGSGDETLLRPFEGETTPAWTGQVPLTQLSNGAKYSWVKGARLDGRVMESGALARVLVAAANGQSEVRLALGGLLTTNGIAADAMRGTLGRALARAVESEVVARKLDAWLWDLKSNLATGDVAVTSVELWDPAAWPDEVEGWSLGEGPRGSVGHWLRIKDKVVDHYQVVDGSTWNASPRDALGLPGPIEAALAGVEVADPTKPVEVLRVVHSFAPCAACAAHVVDPRAAGPIGSQVHVPEATR
ncbi:MAG TPA: nickel-dependent hydrogenase large subunit [Candidatus Limnocylindrales bacterium]|nr:nickel-dependent hydrogenase large subunit [Candidatus Limnocylindrales bacterium]